MTKPVLNKKERKFQLACDVAKSHGGKFLSDKYLGVDYKHKWLCAKGHEWKATYYSVVRQGSWCGRCSGHIVESSEQLKIANDIAKSHGGECLSTEYISAQKHMTWACKKGHEWAASLSNIKHGKWCPYCSGNKVNSIEKIQKAKSYAIERGGECLSTKYTRVHDNMKWRCDKGHEWKASFNSIINGGSWCGRCVGSIVDKVEQLDIAKKVAISKGGICLSKHYINNKDKLIWRCERAHEWGASFDSVVRIGKGSWCPTCSSGLSERIVRNVIEQLFELPFKKQNPSWLVNPRTGRKMELDGYNEEISVAFEYQGEQHNRIVKPFKMDSERFESQQYRDDLKRKLCLKHGVLLIEVPHDVESSDYPCWIYERIKHSSVWGSLKGKINNCELIKVNDWLESEDYSIEDLKKHSNNKGGSCLAGSYTGVKDKYEWQCEQGHKWLSTWDSIKNLNSWCPYCCGNIVDPIQKLNEAKSVAKGRGGECLSTEYTRAKDKMRWKCKHGHEWETRHSHVVLGGSWCPKCHEPREKQ